MIQLACECPHSYLRTHGNLLDYEFCLTHMAEQNESYFNFYKEQNAKGRLTILDNSVFELGVPVEPERIMKVYAQFPKPENVVVVCPDVFNDGAKTLLQAKEFSTQVGPSVRKMAVAQGTTWEEWLNCYEALANDSDIEIMGVTYDATYLSDPGRDLSKTQNQMITRIRLFEKLEILGSLVDKHHHLLGTSDPIELFYQSECKQIRTCDTSFPFVQAIKGKQLRANGLNIRENKEKRPDNYFDLPHDPKVAAIASYNIGQMQLFALGGRDD